MVLLRSYHGLATIYIESIVESWPSLVKDSHVQRAEATRLAHSLLLHNTANRNENLLLVSVASL